MVLRMGVPPERTYSDEDYTFVGLSQEQADSKSGVSADGVGL